MFITRSGHEKDRSNIWRELKQLAVSAGWKPKKYFRIISDICLQEFLQGYWKSVAACGYSGTQQYRGDKDLCFGWNYGMEKEHGNVRDACRMTT